MNQRNRKFVSPATHVLTPFAPLMTTVPAVFISLSCKEVYYEYSEYGVGEVQDHKAADKALSTVTILCSHINYSTVAWTATSDRSTELKTTSKKQDQLAFGSAQVDSASNFSVSFVL